MIDEYIRFLLMKKIFDAVVKSTERLFMCREHSNSLEIITPFSTLTDNYISVFLTQREDKWIVTDGGDLYHRTYGDISLDSEVVQFFQKDYNVVATKKTDGTIIYFKSVQNKELVPNIVFDVANFICNVINTQVFLNKSNI